VRLSPDEASINQLHFLQGSAGGGGRMIGRVLQV
jgi:hypothetical protein